MRLRNPVVANGAYELLRLIGNSGTAEVYEARQTSLNRLVAMKILRIGSDHDEEARRHFLSQAKSVARLRHPNICPVFEVSALEDGAPFMTMELLAGEDLEVLLRREERMPMGRAIKVMAQVCLALAAAHAEGTVHGNLKPRNIHVDQLRDLPDFAKVSDFAFWIAREEICGTINYMSPEQILGNLITDKTDIYMVGTILYRVLTGELPFYRDGSFIVSMVACLQDDVPDICIQFPHCGVPSSLGRLIRQCLARSPEDRPPSARWLADRLNEELVGLSKPLRSAFISYGEPDKLIARKLHEALQDQGVATFFFDEHATPGEKLHRTIRKKVNEHERVILICSRASLDRKGVLAELEETLAREHREGEEYLIPIRLDDYVFKDWAPKNPDVAQAVRDRVVADFQGAEHDDDKFNAGLRKLIAALKK